MCSSSDTCCDAVTPPPPPLPVARLVDDDAVDPGAEGRLAAEAVDGAEDPQEDFLREVERFVVVAEEVQRQLVDHPLVLGHQLGAGILVARRAALNQGRFPPADVGPGDGSNRLHGESLCHLSTPALGSHWQLRWTASDDLEPGRRREVPSAWPHGLSRRWQPGAVSATIPGVKRAIAGASLLLVGGLAAAYGYVVTRRENSHRELIQRGTPPWPRATRRRPSRLSAAPSPSSATR